MKILITGATGFAGSHALQAVVRDRSRLGMQIVRVAVRDASRLSVQTTNLEVHVGDLTNPAYVDQIVEDVDVIIHAAAWTSLTGQRAESRKRYLVPTTDLFRSAGKAGVRTIVNVSTASAGSREARSDAMSPGQMPRYWPHLQNVVRIENLLREMSARGVVGINLRFGLFVGPSSGLSLVGALLPRLRTGLVPWIAHGETRLPLVTGPDIGAAMMLAATNDTLVGYNSFNIVGRESPSAREVIETVATLDGVPAPRISVPFRLAEIFATLSTVAAKMSRTAPLVTRSIVRLLEDTGATNARAHQLLGYEPLDDWRQAVLDQVEDLKNS